MDTHVCGWMYMCVWMCNNAENTQYEQGGAYACMIFGSVAGKFPDTSCPDDFAKKKAQTSNKHTEHGSRAV